MSLTANNKNSKLPVAQNTTLDLKDLLRVEYARDYDGVQPKWHQTHDMPEVGSRYSPQMKLTGKGKAWIKVGIFAPAGLDLLKTWQTLPPGRAPLALLTTFLDGVTACASALDNVAQVYCDCGKCPCSHRFAALYLACSLDNHAKSAGDELKHQQQNCFKTWWEKGATAPVNDPESLLLFAESSYLVLKTLNKVNLDSDFNRLAILKPKLLGPRLSRNEQLLAQSRKCGKTPLTMLKNRKG